jgi:hypothetical protein
VKAAGSRPIEDGKVRKVREVVARGIMDESERSRALLTAAQPPLSGVYGTKFYFILLQNLKKSQAKNR